jgi:hypothetical protein
VGELEKDLLSAFSYHSPRVQQLPMHGLGSEGSPQGRAEKVSADLAGLS